MENKQHDHITDGPHISSYRELTGVWVGLIILTLMTVFISTFGAELRTLSVATALLIATVKALAVGFYFMHLKYEPQIYRVMMLIVLSLFTFFLIMVILDYFTR